MPGKRVRLTRPLDEIVRSVRERVAELDAPPAMTKEVLDARVENFVELNRDLRELSLHHSQELLSQVSASERILDYLRLHLGEPVSGEAIDVISTISEYPRRIREWRVEVGWPIRHKSNTYVLERDEPEGEKARRWQTMNAIRRTDETVRDKMLALLRAYPGEAISRMELQYVSKNADMRRVRELRTQLGWRIMTQNTGMPQLKTAQYVLVDPEPVEEHDRHVDEKVIVKILKRDGNRCQKQGCNWHPNDRIPGDPRQYIELHHITWHVEGGKNELENLITLCNVHHKDIHRNKIGLEAFRAWLQQPD